jgi:DNA-binding transcriptional LysR family regulator
MLREDILKNLPYFVQTAQLGSFSAAAKVMNLTPSAISKNVSLLEKSLGFRLFNRTIRSLYLTEEGNALLQQTSNSLDTLAALIEQLKPLSEEPTGVVKISVANVIGRHILLPLLDKFYQQYPKI